MVPLLLAEAFLTLVTFSKYEGGKINVINSKATPAAHFHIVADR